MLSERIAQPDPDGPACIPPCGGFRLSAPPAPPGAPETAGDSLAGTLARLVILAGVAVFLLVPRRARGAQR